MSHDKLKPLVLAMLFGLASGYGHAGFAAGQAGTEDPEVAPGPTPGGGMGPGMMHGRGMGYRDDDYGPGMMRGGGMGPGMMIPDPDAPGSAPAR